MSKYDSLTMKCPVEKNNPAVYRYSGCIDCGSCLRACREYAGIFGHYDTEKTGDKAICIHCGQCAAECVGFAMQPRSVMNELKAELGKGKLLVASLSPAVRVSVAESFGYPEGSVSEGKICTLLRLFGFDRVLDTNTAADITIMEESAELMRRLEKGETSPMFSSCCPAWVRFAEIFYPFLLPNVSSTKSPVAIQGATVKSWYAEKIGVAPENIVHVAVTPCTAKKAEIMRPELKVNGLCSVDHVLTARELVDWVKECGIDFASLPTSDFDSLMGDASGAAAIFGKSGGVTEAVLRELCYCFGGDAELKPPVFREIEGLSGAKETEVKLGDTLLRAAIIHGTANMRRFLEYSNGGKGYHFVEVMSCPGGCIGGGGQPKRFSVSGCLPSQPRAASLEAKDSASSRRFAHENEEVKRIYEEFYGEALSDKALRYLHTTYTDRSDELENAKAGD